MRGLSGTSIIGGGEVEGGSSI